MRDRRTPSHSHAHSQILHPEQASAHETRPCKSVDLYLPFTHEGTGFSPYATPHIFSKNQVRSEAAMNPRTRNRPSPELSRGQRSP